MKKSTQKFKEAKVTTRDILLAVNKLSDDIEQRFTGVDQKFIGIDQRLDNLEQKVDRLEQKVGNVEGIINTQMVTKDYLDRKFAEFRLEETPKHQRVNKLTDILQRKKILTLADTKIILS